jgi:beta-lactamase regulating signal transducer with metallopeptidase domain
MNSLLNLGISNAAAAAVLAFGVAGAGLLLARRPAWRHCLLLLVLLKLVTPPLWEVPVPALDRTPSPEAPARVTVERVEAPAEFEMVIVESPEEPVDPVEVAPAGVVPAVPEDPGAGISSSTCLGMIWLGGTVATFGLAFVRILRFRRLLRAAFPAPDEIQDEVADLAERLGVNRAPSAWLIDAAVSPMVWSLGWRPRLILPVGLWKGLNSHQKSMVLAHELAHLRRGDHLVRLFELAVTSLYWWLPVTWWARRALREAEEQCCDAWVVWAFPDEARAYAETLLDTIDFLTPTPAPEPLLASGFGRAHQLRRRLTMIMLGTTPRNLGAASTLAAIALSAILLPIRPSLAQKPGEEPKVETVTVSEVSDGRAEDNVGTFSQGGFEG